jgi:hypothetical protein
MTVTLPDGRKIAPCANCFLLYNVDAFAGSYVPDPTRPGLYLADNYCVGNAAVTYSGLRINVTPLGPSNPSNTQLGQPTGSGTYGGTVWLPSIRGSSSWG